MQKKVEFNRKNTFYSNFRNKSRLDSHRKNELMKNPRQYIFISNNSKFSLAFKKRYSRGYYTTNVHRLFINFDFNIPVSVKKVILDVFQIMGAEEAHITFYDQTINGITPVCLYSLVGGSNINVDIYHKAAIFGIIVDPNKITIKEDSISLWNGRIVNASIIKDTLKEKNGVKNALLLLAEIKKTEEFCETMDLDYTDFYYYSRMLKNWEQLIKKAELAQSIYYFKDKSPDDINESVDKNLAPKIIEFENDFESIINHFFSYQTDLIKMMKRPILSDMNDPEVKKFNILCKKVQRNHDIDFFEFEAEWEALISYADTKKLYNFSDQQKKDLNDSKIILNKALDNESTDHEKSISIKVLTAKLENILPINDDVLKWIKKESGLKELEN